MLLTDDVDLRPYLALCARQQQNLEQQLELLRAKDRAGVARLSAEQHRIHAAANASLALALGLKVSRRSATICELLAGRFSYAPCVSVGGGSLYDHPVTLVLPSRPRVPFAIVTHPYSRPDEIVRLAAEAGLRAELLPRSSWNARATGGTNAAILSVDRGGAE